MTITLELTEEKNSDIQLRIRRQEHDATRIEAAYENAIVDALWRELPNICKRVLAEGN